MKPIKLASLLLLSVIIFAGCSKEKPVKYNITTFSPTFEDVYNYYLPSQSDTDKYMLGTSQERQDYFSDEVMSQLKSITVCDNNMSNEDAALLIELAKGKNIPIFFIFDDISSEITAQYDKAYCISADYTYIGEKFAEKILEMWKNEIKDRDGNQIFTFSVINPETLTTSQQNFYDSLLKNIELLGIPLEQLDEIFLSGGDVLEYCEDNKKANETFILLDSSYLRTARDGYKPYSDGVEIIGIDYGTENIYADYPFIKICFIDYLEYFRARDLILENIAERKYPFENITYSILDKNIYIEPVL